MFGRFLRGLRACVMPTDPTVTAAFAQLRADIDTLEAQVNASAPMPPVVTA